MQTNPHNQHVAREICNILGIQEGQIHVHVHVHFSKPLRLRDYFSKLVKLLFVCTICCLCVQYVCLFVCLVLSSFFLFIVLI